MIPTFLPAALEDIPALIGVQNSCFLADFQRYGLCPSYAQAPVRMEAHLREDFVFRILVQGRLAGDIVVIQKSPAHFHLQCLCVLPELEGRGIGGAAMDFIEARFPHARRRTLVTPADKERNHAFYAQHGFEIIEAFETGPVSMVRLEKRIP